jgi:pimeloyl-ACP methyl ester carboxylesterase
MNLLHSRIDGTGKPLLILHGFLGMSDNWKTLSGQYAAAGFQVHALDLRNHGRSFHSPIFTYDAMAEDILDYMAAQSIGKADIIGHSMGGKVAMLFAVEHPKKVEKLVVADIAPKYYPPHHDEILNALSAVDFSKKPDRHQVEEILKPNIPDVGTRQFLLKSLYWKTPGQLDWRFNLRAFLDNRDIIGEALPGEAVFEKPTLFIRGGNSDYIKDEDLLLIKKHFPNAVLRTIPGVGHWLHAEKPEVFLGDTVGFLKA